MVNVACMSRTVTPEHLIYFDYNATTPLDPAVREAMLPFWDAVYGNPSSVHRLGRRARAFLDEARERVAQVWSCKPSEVIFTSGGTESVNLALLGSARCLQHRGRHLITSAVEHHAVLHACDYLAKREGFEVTRLPVDAAGRVDPDALRAAIRPDTILVSVMAANNEVGTVQPVAELGAICRDRGVRFHTDAVQWFGKEPLDSIHEFDADLVSVCAHKFHGPKGAGALFVRSPATLDPILFGGGHENEHRAGTENLAAIIGLAEASERFIRTPVFPRARLQALTQRLVDGLRRLEPAGVRLRGWAEPRLSNTVAFTFPSSDSITLLANLDLEGICASSGSACSSGSVEPSHVILALGGTREEANALVRFSLGRESTEAEVDLVLGILPKILDQARGAGLSTSLDQALNNGGGL